MGCGASATTHSAHRWSTSFDPTAFAWNDDFGTAKTSQYGTPVIAYDMVLAQATKPEWSKPEHLVFQQVEQEHESEASSLHRSNSDISIHSIRTEDEEPKELHKGGRFYSKNTKSIGTWKIIGNVLQLSWALSDKTDSLIAKTTSRRWVNEKTLLKIRVLEPRPVNPTWFLPDILHEKFRAVAVSMESFECPVCFLDLFRFPPGVIRTNSRRSCQHYFHKQCATYLLNLVRGSNKLPSCPVCGATFTEVISVPDLATQPSEWFGVCDVDFGGDLDFHEVVESLGCVLPVSRSKLEKWVRTHWRDWDPDGDGTISLQEFINPGTGLRDWILNHINLVIRDDVYNKDVAPDVDRCPRVWFNYWDRNENGTLERDELMRALVRSFCIDENGKQILRKALDLQEVAGVLWSNLGYSPFDTMTIEEFVKPFGLLDQFLHNQIHCMYFGEDDI